MQTDDPVQIATNACLRLLKARDRSRGELAAYLDRKGFEPNVRDAVLERLLALGYLDDARFAERRAESLIRNKRLSKGAIAQRLIAHGVSHDLAKRAAERAQRELAVDDEASARALLGQRRLAPPFSDPKQYARAARLLSARGFSESVQEKLLGEAPLDDGGDNG